MITPFFNVSQDDEFVFLAVKVAHIRFSALALEMVADGELFIFSLHPYYLRLRFPRRIVDDERAQASFDSKEGFVNIKLPKENRGEFFPDLDLTQKLLARKSEPEQKKPLIQELDVDNSKVSDGAAAEGAPEGNTEGTTEGTAQPTSGALLEEDWEIEQSPALTATEAGKYGFNNAFTGIVGVSLTNGNDINELGDPETASPGDRILERLVKENIKFDPEYYAADYIMLEHPSPDDDKLFAGILLWKSPVTKRFLSWYKHQQQLPSEQREQVMPVEFSKQEQEKMLELPRKSYLVEPAHRLQLLVLIVSLLFAYHFDLRENEGEHNIESAWTVGKLIPQFAFLDSQLLVDPTAGDSILKAAAIAAERRALLYPYYRNYNLVRKVWDDVYYTLRAGKRMVLKCILDLKELFRFHDIYYVYDKIWLEDLCSWIISDQLSEANVRELAHDLKTELSAITKQHITFEKVDDTQDDDEMIALDISEVEAMAEDSYANS